jgi:hypothetical protein
MRGVVVGVDPRGMRSRELAIPDCFCQLRSCSGVRVVFGQLGRVLLQPAAMHLLEDRGDPVVPPNPSGNAQLFVEYLPNEGVPE